MLCILHGIEAALLILLAVFGIRAKGALPKRRIIHG